MWYPVYRLAALNCFIFTSAYAASWSDELIRGNLRFDSGLYRAAIADYESALPLAESPLQRAVTLDRLGLAHGKLAEFAAAEQYYQKSLNLFRASGDSSKVALSLVALGEIYRGEHRLDDSLATERNALRFLRRAGLEETKEAATVFTITGAILSEKHRLKAAEHAMREALDILQRTAGPDDPDFATTLNNLGVVISARKRASEAEELLTRALNMREARFGSEHPLIASTLLNLSSVYLDQKRYAEADQTCRRSLEMMGHFLPANHPDLIAGHIWLALIAHRSGNSAAAIRSLEEGVRNHNAQPSAITGEYLQLLNLYSKYLGEAGESEKSREFRLETRQLLERYGRPSPAGASITLSELEADRLR
jgi:tetratricopeptide (TPR) repeat protein